MFIYLLTYHLHTPIPPFSPFTPSQISLMASVDVKHNVYLLTRGGRPGIPVLMIIVSVDVKQH